MVSGKKLVAEKSFVFPKNRFSKNFSSPIPISIPIPIPIPIPILDLGLGLEVGNEIRNGTRSRVKIQKIFSGWTIVSVIFVGAMQRSDRLRKRNRENF
jgi:hypothetical protein